MSIIDLGSFLPFLSGYLLGAIPFGLLLTKAFHAGDLRAIGSGNIGATNVLRTGRKGLAATTLLLDALKGTAAILLAEMLWGEAAARIAALGAMLGHIYPVWLGFKGGKGVATYIGALTALHPPAALVFAAIWSACAYLTRISSLSGLLAALITPLTLIAFDAWPLAGLFALLTGLVWFTHASNISRLLKGTEPRIGVKE